MRILLATHHLVEGAGTETYVRTVALALADRDHQVFVYSPFRGAVADELVAAGIAFTDDITTLRHAHFSVAHVHHNIIATQVRATLPDVPMVWLRHGVIPELELPPSFAPEVALATSPERTRVSVSDDVDELPVVPNPIDTAFYAPRRPIRPVPGTAVVITNHLSPSAWRSIEGACSKLGVAVRHVGLPDNAVADVRDAIDEADIVLAVGRTALEAGSMARAVLIHDHHGCDGWLDRANYRAAADFAFSGRNSWYLPDADELADLIAREYSEEKGREAREVVLERHALDVVIPELERHYRRAIEIGRRDPPHAVALAPNIAEQLAYYQREMRGLRARIESVTNERNALAAADADEKAELEQTRAALEQVRAELEQTRAALEQTQTALGRSQAALAEVQAELDRESSRARALDETVASLGAELDAVYTSYSWRLSTPLRALKKLVRRSIP